MTDKYDPDKDGDLVVAQIGAIRMVGVLQPPEYGVDDDAIILQGAGAVVTQRGAMPGQIAGTVLMTKSVSIVSLDFCKGPLKRVVLKPDLKYVVNDSYMDEADVKVFIENYNLFLSGEAANIVSQGGQVP